MPALLRIIVLGYVGLALAPQLLAQVGPPAPKRLALLVGIDDYASPAINDLNGAVNDVVLLESVLKQSYRVPAESIRVLKNAQATRANIIKAFQEHLIAKADANTVVLFHFSGYGSRVIDNNDDEADGYDESIVPADSRQNNVFDIDDDEQARLFQELTAKTKHVVAVFDCGLSSSQEQPAMQSRALPTDTRPQPPRAAAGGQRVHLRIFASRSGDQAYEGPILKDQRGFLSYAWATELRTTAEASAPQTYRDVVDRVQFQVRNLQPAQWPVLEESEVADELVLALERIPAQPYFPATKDGLNVWIAGGRLQGFKEGNMFRVFPPGAKRLADSPIGNVQLTEVGSEESKGKFVYGSWCPVAARAVPFSQNEHPAKIRVYLAPLLRESRALAEIRQDLAEHAAAFEVVSAADAAEFTIRQEPLAAGAAPKVTLLVGQLSVWTVTEQLPELSRHMLLRMIEHRWPPQTTKQVGTVPRTSLPSNIHGLFVGIDHYEQVEFNLRGCVNDAKEISAALKSVTLTHRTLFDEQATKSSILDEVEGLMRKAVAGDLIVLVFSCHGSLFYDDLYLIPHNFNHQHTLSTGLAFSVVTDALNSKQGVHSLILIDSCHSGQSGFDIARYRGSQHMSSVMVACSPDERAMEVKVEENKFVGQFTSSLVKGFKGPADENHDGHITIRELFDYGYVETKTGSKGTQHPLFFGSLNQNLVIRTLNASASTATTPGSTTPGSTTPGSTTTPMAPNPMPPAPMIQPLQVPGGR